MRAQFIQGIWKYKPQESFLAKYFGKFQSVGMATTKRDSENAEIARRLATLRRVISGDNQTAFARQLGIEVKRWNNFERGLPLSKDVAFLLVKKIPGLTLDWLWLGVESGLPIALQRELAEAGKALTSAKGARG
jgi:hypothetical protein